MRPERTRQIRSTARWTAGEERGWRRPGGSTEVSTEGSGGEGVGVVVGSIKLMTPGPNPVPGLGG